jgi:hypothetical protein
MSALCQKQTFCAAAQMSLFDHLIGGGAEHKWEIVHGWLRDRLED